MIISDHTMERLLRHIEFRAQHPTLNNAGQLDRWIDIDVNELKAAIMTHALSGLDYFNLNLPAYVVDREAYDINLEEGTAQRRMS